MICAIPLGRDRSPQAGQALRIGIWLFMQQACMLRMKWRSPSFSLRPSGTFGAQDWTPFGFAQDKLLTSCFPSESRKAPLAWSLLCSLRAQDWTPFGFAQDKLLTNLCR